MDGLKTRRERLSIVFAIIKKKKSRCVTIPTTRNFLNQYDRHIFIVKTVINYCLQFIREHNQRA